MSRLTLPVSFRSLITCKTTFLKKSTEGSIPIFNRFISHLGKISVKLKKSNMMLSMLLLKNVTIENGNLFFLLYSHKNANFNQTFSFDSEFLLQCYTLKKED